MEKPVVVRSSLIPNLLQFVLVGLDAGGFGKMVNPAYRDECSTWISHDHKRRFVNSLNSLRGVSSSTWFALLYQIPGYLSEDNLSSLMEVLNLLSIEDTTSVILKYPDKTPLIDRYIPRDNFHILLGFQGEPVSPWPALLQEYSTIINDSYNRIYRERWNSIELLLHSKQEDLEREYLTGFDWVNWWERRTGIEFEYPRFQVELIDAMTTMGTSLLAERDGFYAHGDSVRLVTMISHEICTHLLFSREAFRNESIASLIRANLERYLRVVEIVSWATNRELIEEIGLKWTMEKSFDWVGPKKDAVADLMYEKGYQNYWQLVRDGFKLMDEQV